MTRRRLIIALSLLLAVLVITAAGWLAAGITPSWYAPADPSDADVEAKSERKEFAVQQALQQIRTDQPRWLLVIPDDVFNKWLATRLGPWLRGQQINWPDGVGTPQVRCREGVIEVGVPLESLGGRIGRVDLKPVITPDGITFTPEGCGIGCLPVGFPVDWVLGDFTDAPLIGTPVAAIIDLIDDRTVQILDVRPTRGQLELDLETRPPWIP